MGISLCSLVWGVLNLQCLKKQMQGRKMYLTYSRGNREEIDSKWVIPCDYDRFSMGKGDGLAFFFYINIDEPDRWPADLSGLWIRPFASKSSPDFLISCFLNA